MSELISVIVPAYNAEQYIARCISSIQNQYYENIEMIIIDDGSTDGTFNICKQKAENDKRIRVIHQENRGVCAARNTGMDAACGKYISFVDADDELTPEALETLYRTLKQENAQISTGRSIRFGSETRKFTGKLEVWRGTEALEKSLEDNPYTYSACGKLYESQFVDCVRFIEGKRVHEDSFFVFQCSLRQPKTVCLDENVYIVHAVTNSASRSAFSDKFFDILYFAERKVELIKNEYPQFEDKTHNLLIKANMALLSNLRKANWTQYRRQERECIATIKQLKGYFRPAIEFDKRWFFIITHHLYPAFKLLYKVKYSRNV